MNGSLQRESSNRIQPKRTYRGPSNSDIVDYSIRLDANHLHEDPDTEDGIVYRITPGTQITEDQITKCARHFSRYYGVWSKSAWKEMDSRLRHGQRVRMSPDRLRAQCLPEEANNILVATVTESGRQIGHCFVTQWVYGNHRIWWISQILVLPSYRNQRRATKMLRALVLHYDIGKTIDKEDFVGILSSHPFAISAILRVFGRGIETLPSRPDWKIRPSYDPHSPLSMCKCASILKTSPVDYVRRARLCPKTLTANTSFFIDHTESNQALRRILFAMNKQIVEPWQWMFGNLVEGYEYVCILRYRHDAEYTARPEFCSRPHALDKAVSLMRYIAKSVVTPARYRSPSSISQPSFDYVEIYKYLLDFPESCSLDPALRYRTHISTANRTVGRKVIEAKEMLYKCNTNVGDVMNAKRIPENLRAFISIEKQQLPDHISTWIDLIQGLEYLLNKDAYIIARLQILQAIHFNELNAQFFGPHRSATVRKQKVERTPDRIEKSRGVNTSQLLDRSTKHQISQSANRTERPSNRTPARDVDEMKIAGPVIQTTRVQRNRNNTSFHVDVSGTSPFTTPSKTAIPARIDSVEPRVKASVHRPSDCSPRLFFSDSSSRESYRSNVPARQFPRNSGEVLNRQRRY